MPSVRCTPGPRIPGRPEADRIAVLHQFGRPGVLQDEIDKCWNSPEPEMKPPIPDPSEGKENDPCDS